MRRVILPLLVTKNWMKHWCSLILNIASRAVVAHACNPSTLGGRGRWISEFEASLVYRVSSRTARAIQRNPVLKKTNPKKQKRQKRNQNSHHRCGCLPACGWILHEHVVPREGRRGYLIPRSWSPMAESCGSWNWTQVLGKSSQCSDHWAISSAPD